MRQHPVFYEMALVKAKFGLWHEGHALRDINDAVSMTKDSLPMMIDTLLPADVSFTDTPPHVTGLLSNVIDGIRNFLSTDLGKQLVMWLEDLLKGLLTK